MALAIDFFGFTYDNVVPAFINVNAKNYLHVPSKRLLDRPALDAAMTAAGYTPKAKEIGDDAAFLLKHFGLGSTPTTTPPATAPVTATVAGAGTVTATITIAGGAAGGASAGTVTITGLASGSANITGVSPVPVSAGDTLNDVATHIAAELDSKADAGTTVEIHAVAAAAVVTITEKGGGMIDAGLAANVA